MPDRRSRLPTLNALKAFEAAARSRTLEEAAATLHVTHGAVSRQIRALEDDLGDALFARQGRGRVLTERGRALADRLGDIFEDLSQAIDAFRRDGAPQPLSVSCEPTLCLKLLIRSLGALKRETGLEIKLFAAGGPVDFDRGSIDLAVRRADFDIPAHLHVQDLAEEAVGPVLSPARVGSAPDTGLRSLPQLHTSTRPEAWANWVRASGTRLPRSKREMFEHHYLALEAAQAGHGVALASVYMAASEIEAGLLVAPHGFVRDATRYVCLSPVAFRDDPRREAFAAWLRAHMTRVLRGFLDGQGRAGGS